MSLFWPSGPNAISVSLSPMGRYVMVGLASRRILLHPSTEHMVAQVFRLQQAHGGETSMRVSVSLLVPSAYGYSTRLGRVMKDSGVISRPGPERSCSEGTREDSSPAHPWPAGFTFGSSGILKGRDFLIPWILSWVPQRPERIFR